jgi:TDG/mug DNA glycosylase family protein
MKNPTRAQLVAAKNKTVPDVIGHNLKVLFCGINPGLYSGAVGHHFARPGNRFWKAMHLSGFTPTQFSPFDGAKLLQYGYGITNIVARTTAAASDLSVQELKDGEKILTKKVLRYKPKITAVLGIGAYRTAFNNPRARLGPQKETIGKTRLWVLPSPSGLNASYQMKDLVKFFKMLKKATNK